MDMRGFDWVEFDEGELAYGIIGDIFDGSEPDIFTELAGARGYVFTEERSRDEWPEGSMGTWLVKEPGSKNVIMEPESYCKAHDIEVFISFTNLKNMLGEARKDVATKQNELEQMEYKADQRLWAMRNLASHAFGMEWDEQETALELGLRIANEIAPRTMPEGMVWPTFKREELDWIDGSFPYIAPRKVTFDDFYENGTKDMSGKMVTYSVGRFTFNRDGSTMIDDEHYGIGSSSSQTLLETSEDMLKHARYIYDHDHISIENGQSVYRIRGGKEYRVVNLYMERGKILLSSADDATSDATSEYMTCPPSHVTTALPVFDANGTMILKEDEVWALNGQMRYLVTNIGYTCTVVPLIGEYRPIKVFASKLSLEKPKDTQAILDWCLTLTDDDYLTIYKKHDELYGSGLGSCAFVKSDINKRQKALDAELCICEDGSCPVKNPDIIDDGTNTPEDENNPSDKPSDGSDEPHWAPSVPVSHNDDIDSTILNSQQKSYII